MAHLCQQKTASSFGMCQETLCRLAAFTTQTKDRGRLHAAGPHCGSCVRQTAGDVIIANIMAPHSNVAIVSSNMLKLH